MIKQFSLVLPFLLAIACSDSTPPAALTDAGDHDAISQTDAARDSAPPIGDGGAKDACVAPTLASNKGETCVGFGMGTPCDSTCNTPYGYVCFAGGPPNIAGCTEVSTSSFGNTYCCQNLGCVRQPDQDPKCARGKQRVQCATDQAGTLLTQPSAGCTEDVASGGSGSRFYCCAQ